MGDEFSKPQRKDVLSVPDSDRYRCSFTASGVQCLQPGTMTDAVIGPSKGQTDMRRWLCRWHFAVKDDFAGGCRVLDDLMAHKQPRMENWRDKLVHEHIVNNRDDPLMARALLIAEGKGSEDDKRDLLHDLRRKIMRIGAACEVQG